MNDKKANAYSFQIIQIMLGFALTVSICNSNYYCIAISTFLLACWKEVKEEDKK